MLANIIITSLVILGVWHITQEGEPFHFVRKFLDRWGLKERMVDGYTYAKEPRTLYYPVLYCNRCMSSLWGVVFFFILPNTPSIWLLPVHVIAVYGLVWVVTNAEVEE